MNDISTPSQPAVAGGDPAPIDPQLRPFIAELVQAQPAGTTTLGVPIAEARERAEHVRARWRRGGPQMAAVEDSNLATANGLVRIRRFVPRATNAEQPALIYLHGGGWSMFSLDTHDRIMRELAARADVTVIGVDYALAPESKFPVALNQIAEIVRWLSGHGKERGIDGRRLAIGGDSSGANLAVATALMLRDTGSRDLLRGLLLAYGCYASDPNALSGNAYGAEGSVLTSGEMSAFWDNYQATPTDARNPLAAPMGAQLEGLPPTFQVIAQCDVLAAQNRDFAVRLRQAGVATEAREYVGATHSFLEAISIADVAERALEDSARWLRRCLGGAPPAGNANPSQAA